MTNNQDCIGSRKNFHGCEHFLLPQTKVQMLQFFRSFTTITDLILTPLADFVSLFACNNLFMIVLSSADNLQHNFFKIYFRSNIRVSNSLGRNQASDSFKPQFLSSLILVKLLTKKISIQQDSQFAGKEIHNIFFNNI